MNITSNLSLNGDYGFEAFYLLTGNLVGMVQTREKLFTRITLLDGETLKVSLMRSDTYKNVVYIKGSLCEGVFNICTSSPVTKVIQFIKHWRTQKINIHVNKQQLLIFLSKTGSAKIAVFKDITYYRIK